MKPSRTNLTLTRLMAVMILALLSSFAFQQAEPWTLDQLMEPADLASVIRHPEKPQPLVISVGPGAVIKGSHDIGPAGEKANLKKLQDHLETVPKDADVVIYCGCCPFSKCPNIRPAFTLLNKMGFRNHKLLNIEQNVKVNWIDQGYPVNN